MAKGSRSTVFRTSRSYLGYLALSASASAVLFLYFLLPARSLDTSSYGLFASLFGVVVLLGILFTAAQTYVAGVIAGGETGGRSAAISALTRTIGLWLVWLAIGLTIATPLVAVVLRAPILTVALVSVLAIFTLIWASLLGVIQGEQKFVWLGGVNLAQALFRLAGLALVISQNSIDSILIATIVSMVPSIVLALVVARPRWYRRPHPTESNPAVIDVAIRSPNPMRGILLTLVVTFVVGFPTVGDVILVRASHEASTAGQFAIVSLIGRVVIFLAILLNAVAYPRFVQRVETRDSVILLMRASAAIFTLAAPVVLVALIAPAELVRLVAGESTVESTELVAPYVVASTIFAVASCGCYFQLARANRRYVVGFLLPFVAVLMLMCLTIVDLKALLIFLGAGAFLLLLVNAVLARRVLRNVADRIVP